ncbi:MAG: Bcr/CflA family multidrug efflux MFS transporter [Candidatus Competibacteraceae bacterium]|nr:Bcr/CflA family multidrug efflux MFS transporter [Candidatus Competibacteraceae bacterium]MCP5124964.1 Bcr/CflA family multidrug efflux MFS transporter [Gammaproteobacteria bacterium]HRX69910.1 Bcr/CflA family multidrug efflux MFS transporter [Candidatus Competibacteraceae bacterium]
MSATLPLSWLLILGGLIAFAPMSIDMYLPGLPAIAADFSVATSAAQFTLSSFFIGLALGQAIHGPLADRYGRKPPLYLGLTLYVIASVGCALTTDMVMLIALRFIQAIGGCAGIVIARAIVRDCCDPLTAARVFSLLMLIMGLAPILAPFIGGWILWFAGWRAIFAVLALFGLGCLFAVWRVLPETRPADTIASTGIGAALRVYGDLLIDRRFIGYVLSGGFAHAGMFAYITGSPHVFIEVYGVSAQNFGWLFGLNALGLIASSQVNRRLLLRYSTDTLLRRANRATVLLGLAMLLIAASDWGGLPGLLAPLFCYSVSLGFTAPNAMANALAQQGQRAGSASALIGALQFGVATLASMAVGLAGGGSALPMAAVIASCGLLAYIAHRAWVGKGMM